MTSLEMLVIDYSRAKEPKGDERPPIVAAFDDVAIDSPINRALTMAPLGTIKEILVNGFRLRMGLEQDPLPIRQRLAQKVFGQQPGNINSTLIVTVADHGRELKIWSAIPRNIALHGVGDRNLTPIIGVHARNRDTAQVENCRELLMKAWKNRPGHGSFILSEPIRHVRVYTSK